MERPRAARRPPGRSMWLNGVLLALAVCYVAFGGATLKLRGLFDHVGVDYRTFYCSAQIAWHQGFARVYDLDQQELCQRAVYESYATGPLPAGYVTVPTPYPPPFLLPFLALLPLGPAAGFLVWTLLNGAGLLLYLRRFARAAHLSGMSDIWVVALSFSAYMTLFLGQVNVWMLICLGEFLLAGLRGQELRGGLWLGGWLLKPQFLALLGLGLLVGRRWKVVAGLAIAGGIALALSLLLAGPAGLLAAAQLLLRYPGNLPSTAPEWMMNWRALALNLEALLPGPVAWGIALTGLALTVGTSLWLWWRTGGDTSDSFAIAVLGTAAASCAVAWHAHTHSALLMVPPLLLLRARARARLPRSALLLWAAGPALLYFPLLPLPFGLSARLSGLGMLAINVGLLIWAARELRAPGTPRLDETVKADTMAAARNGSAKESP